MQRSATCSLFAFSVVLASVATSQEPAPTGIVRGELLEIRKEASGGSFDLRSDEGSVVYRCDFDQRTYMERNRERINRDAIGAGDHLEVLTDRRPGAASCYARIVRLMVVRPAVVNPGYRVNLRPAVRERSSFEQLFPRGNLTFAGVVLRMNPEMMVVRTRTEGEKTIMLRHDTRYMENGLPSELSALGVNTRIFIRGGRNLEDELEAFQVIWGEIAGPKSR